MFLRPLSYRGADRIVTLTDRSATEQARTTLSKQVSDREFQEWRSQSSSFEAMAYYGTRETAVIGAAGGEYARVAGVSPEFFHVFAVEPVAGRFPTAEEIKPGGSGAVLISYEYWQSHFGGDARALGQTLRVYGLQRLSGCFRRSSDFRRRRICGLS